MKLDKIKPLQLNDKKPSTPNNKNKPYQITPKKFINLKSFTNWSKTYHCQPQFYAKPSTIEDLRTILKFCKKNKLKACICGAMLSPSDLAMTEQFLIDMRNFNRLLKVDIQNSAIKVQTGMVLENLVKILDDQYGLGLSVMGSIMKQTIGGLLGTAVHGTGRRYGSFCSLVNKMRVMKSDGEIIILERDKPADNNLFNAVLVGLGLMGIIIDIELRVERVYNVSIVQMPINTSDLLDKLNTLSFKYEYFRAWVIPHTGKSLIWYGDRVPHYHKPHECSQISLKSFYHQTKSYLNPLTKFSKLFNLPAKTINFLFQSFLFVGNYYPSIIPFVNQFYFLSTMNKRTESTGVYHELFTFDCLFDQHVSEWAFDAYHAEEVLTDLLKLIDKKKFKVHLPIEIRFVAREEGWLSPSYDGTVCYIGIIMYRPYGIDSDYIEYFECFEDFMKSRNGRPHWAKKFNVGKDYFRQIYHRWDDWIDCRKILDPDGIFGNKWTDRNIN